MDIERALAYGRQMLSQTSEHAARDAATLLSHVLRCSVPQLYLYPDTLVGVAQFSRYSSMIQKRAKKKPIDYIIGYSQFMGFNFKVDKRVLIPRPETEILVETCISLLESKAEKFQRGPLIICDVCCGSGAIGLSLLKMLYKNQNERCSRAIKMILTDISSDVLDVAEQNAKMLDVFKRVEFLIGDGLKPLMNGEYAGKVNLIASNPPYIPTNVIDTLDEQVKCYEPHIALDGGFNGMDFIDHMIQYSPEVLAPGGFLVMEIGHDQADKCKLNPSWHNQKFVKDYSGKRRVLIAQRV